MATTGFTTLTPSDLRERVAKLPRIRGFALTPTPLEDLPRLADAIGGPRILMKRDDLTGFAFGGNKVRAIEFRMADARAKGCDALVLTNIGQSNHARIHAAACKRLGLKMVLVKPGPKGERVQGNLLLDHMLDIEIVETGIEDDDEVRRIVEGVLADLRARGFTPYDVKREPFSRLAGTVAYAEATIELLDQVSALGATADHVFVVGGTSAAGLALGAKVLGASFRVHPISVGATRERLLEQELELSNRVCGLLDLPPLMTESDFCVHDEYVGDKYGDAPPATLEAIRMAARIEGVFLDPVYSGKGFSGLIGEIRKGAVRKGETAVFVHTGGLPIIFAYDEILAKL